MNRLYIIVPVVLLGIFIFFHRGATQEAKIKEQAKIAAETKKKEEEQRKKQELEEKAAIDNERRTQQRIKEDQEREAARQARYEAAVKRIQDELDRYKSDIESNTKLSAQLEKDLASMRARREKEGREVFDLQKRVELARVQRRNAELEIQRFTEMVARKAAESSMAKGPAVTATAPAR